MTEHRALSLGISRKDGVTDGIGGVSGGNEQGRKYNIVSVSNVNLRFCDRRTLDRSILEGSVIGFDMGIITDAMRSIEGWRH